MVKGSTKLLTLLALLAVLTTSFTRPQLINGFVSSSSTYIRCNTGCPSCSSTFGLQLCLGSGCGEGFIPISTVPENDNTKYCMACMSGCKQCSQTDVTDCTSCYDGAYIGNQLNDPSIQTCFQCDEGCLKCSGAANNCTDCSWATYLDSSSGYGVCKPCAKNCQYCTVSGCVTCMAGYERVIINGEQACRPCMHGCNGCSQSDITSCEANCGSGYGIHISTQECIYLEPPCTTISYSIGICSGCIPTSFIEDTSNGVCIVKCSSPCKFCEADQPTNCTECFDGSTLVNNTCQLDLTCNSGDSCTYKSCGSGFNKIYKQAQSRCVDCPAIDNCIQCDLVDNSRCSICEIGYYLSGVSNCTKCPDTCPNCKNEYICYNCTQGLVLLNGATGRCKPCIRPCLTCHISQANCLTCISGYTKNGTKCISEKKVGFELVLSASTTAEVNAVIDDVYSAILSAAGFDTSEMERVTIYNMTLGSVVLSGSVDGDENTTDDDLATISANFISNLASASIGGLTVASVSTDVPPVTNPSSGGGSTTAENDDDEIGLIIGLSIGGAAIVAIVVILVCYVMRSKKHMMVQEDSGEFANSKDIIQVENQNNWDKSKGELMGPANEQGTLEVKVNPQQKRTD